MVLVLPAPLRPTRQTVSPSRTSRSTPCSARLCPYAACRSESFSMSVPRSEVDVLHFPMPGDFIGSAFGEYLAARHDGYTLCQTKHDIEIMFDEQTRRTGLGCAFQARKSVGLGKRVSV